MSLSINAFKGAFKAGARPNLYQVTVPTLENLQFLCKASQLPGSVMGIIDVPYMGRQLKVAGNRTFSDWVITVLNDTDFKIREAVEAWSSLINGYESNVGQNTVSNYFKDAKVQQLDQTGAEIYAYDFKDIWPTDIGEIELAYDSNDAIEEFQVTFAVGTYFLSPGAK